LGAGGGEHGLHLSGKMISAVLNRTTCKKQQPDD
jgi:hypothetical protein